MRKREPGPTIVYVTLQRTAETLAERLHAAGFPARPYHAGMEDADREEIQNWFIASERGIVVATIAFGMGIDKADVRYVYHYNPPKSLENYAQEIGRAGRDGRPSVCEMFFCPDDLNVLENFVYGDTPSLEAVEGLVRRDFRQRRGVRRERVRVIVDARHPIHGGPHVADLPGTRRPPGTRHAVLRHVSIQAAENVGRDSGPFRRRAKEVSGRFVPAGEEGERSGSNSTLTRRVRRSASRGIAWSGRSTIWPSKGTWNCRSPACGTGSSCSAGPTIWPPWRSRCTKSRSSGKRREIARLGQVAALVEHDGCQVSALGGHFGDPLAQPCGHCSWCLQGGRPSRLPPRPEPRIDPAVLSQGLSLRHQYAAELRNPRSLARFLCGVSSPHQIRAKLQKHPLFGVLSHVPFPAVLERVEKRVRIGDTYARTSVLPSGSERLAVE